MSRQPVTTDDLIACGTVAQESLSNLTDEQWLESPPDSTWTRYIIGSHINGALQFYATQLASGSETYTPTLRLDEQNVKGNEWPALVLAESRVLAMVASWSIERQVKGYCILFLLLEAGMLGVFLALDFFLFYIF